MPPTPTISVILPAYNIERYLAKAIQSIIEQTFTDFELLIVNDGSVDNTQAVAQGFDDNRIHIINNPRNIGLMRTLNVGIKHAKAALIARQDADDWSHPNRFQKQIDFMNANPDVAACSTNRINVDENGNEQPMRPMPPAPTYASMKKRNEMVHTSAVIRKSVLDEVGGYNEHFRSAEDYELWLRIIQKHPIANLPEPLCYIRVHSQSSTGKAPGDLVRWHMLALAVTQGAILAISKRQITQADVQRYYQTGIENFATEMPIALREEYLTLLAAGLKNAKHYRQALAVFCQLRDVQGWNWKVARNIAKMWIKVRWA